MRENKSLVREVWSTSDVSWSVPLALDSCHTTHLVASGGAGSYEVEVFFVIISIFGCVFIRLFWCVFSFYYCGNAS